VTHLPPPPEPDLDPGERALLARGIEEFSRRLFFECHDTLEELWSGVRGPSRDFFQGLIQAAVGFYHLGNGNREGARRLFGRALGRLERYPSRYAGVDAGPLRASLRRFRDALDAGDEPPAEEPPPIALSRSPRGDA
jgi:predicted metal-dependent hydrolase